MSMKQYSWNARQSFSFRSVSYERQKSKLTFLVFKRKMIETFSNGIPGFFKGNISIEKVEFKCLKFLFLKHISFVLVREIT